MKILETKTIADNIFRLIDLQRRSKDNIYYYRITKNGQIIGRYINLPMAESMFCLITREGKE